MTDTAPTTAAPPPGTRLQSAVIALAKWFVALVGLVLIPQLIYAGVQVFQIERHEIFEVGLTRLDTRAGAPTLEQDLLLIHTNLDRLECTPPARGPVGDGMGWRARCTGRLLLGPARTPDVRAVTDSQWGVVETKFIPNPTPALAQLIPPWWLLALCALPTLVLTRHRWRADLAGVITHPLASFGWLLLPPLTSLAVGYLGRALGAVREEMMTTLGESLAARPDWALVAAIVLMAPLLEELVFRGLAWRWLRPTLGAAGTIAVSVVTFTGLHAGQYGLFGIAMIAALALVLGLIRERTGSLALCIGGHVLVNAMAIGALLAS